MNKEIFQERIKKFIAGPVKECKIYAILKNGDIRLLDIEQQDLDNLNHIYYDLLSSKCLGDEITILNYSTADDRNNCFYYYDLNDCPDIFTLISSIHNIKKVDSFDLSKNKFQDIDAIVCVLFNGQEKISLCKYLNSFEVIVAKDKFIFSSYDNRFVRRKTDMLKIVPGIDIIEMNGKFVILNLKQVEKKSKLVKIIENEAVSNIKHIHKINLISNIDKLEDIVREDIRLAKLFVKTTKSSRVLFSGVNSQQIISFAKKKEKKIGSLSYSSDGKSIIIKSKTEFKTLMSLLNNDYLRSELTGDDYYVLAKDLL